MCFSAGASFAAGAVLSSVGFASVTKSKKPGQRLFAAIPLIFGLQQFAEGVLWVTLSSGGQNWLQGAATYIFLITALVIWPVMVPLSMWFMEKVKNRKRILSVLIVTGAMVSLFYAFCLISYDVTPRINSFHIQYIDEFPRIPVDIAYLFYVASTITPLFISSVKRMWLFGILILISYLVTLIFFAYYLTSVWCFFAAFASVAVYLIISKSRAAIPSINKEKGLMANG